MSQLVRLEGKHSTQNAHCAMANQACGSWKKSPCIMFFFYCTLANFLFSFTAPEILKLTQCPISSLSVPPERILFPHWKRTKYKKVEKGQRFKKWKRTNDFKSEIDRNIEKVKKDEWHKKRKGTNDLESEKGRKI